MAKCREQSKQLSLITYLTDALMVISENTSKMVGKGRYMNKRYYDLVYKPESKKKKDTRTGKQVADDIIGRLGSGT